MKVSGVMVVTGHAEAEHARRSLPALQPQVGELVVIANGPEDLGELPGDARVLRNERMLGFSANINQGVAATSGEYVVVSNPDAAPEPDAVGHLVAFADAHPRCGVAGPRMVNPDGTLQTSRRRFPTVAGTMPAKAARTTGASRTFAYMEVRATVMAALGSSNPTREASAPSMPDTRHPIRITSPRMLMPGAIWQIPQ